MMHVAEAIALGYRYPGPSAAAGLSSAVKTSTRGVVERHMSSFVAEVTDLPLGKWEELHTSTLDLSPQFVPYVGHIAWGENYRRGEFMAQLKRAMSEADVDLGGELPDHIEPVLRYLAKADDPLADLVEVLPGAVATMAKTLDKASPGNAYRHLLAATEAFTADLRPLSIGARHDH